MLQRALGIPLKPDSEDDTALCCSIAPETSQAQRLLMGAAVFHQFAAAPGQDVTLTVQLASRFPVPVTLDWVLLSFTSADLEVRLVHSAEHQAVSPTGSRICQKAGKDYICNLSFDANELAEFELQLAVPAPELSEHFAIDSTESTESKSQETVLLGGSAFAKPCISDKDTPVEDIRLVSLTCGWSPGSEGNNVPGADSRTYKFTLEASEGSYDDYVERLSTGPNPSTSAAKRYRTLTVLPSEAKPVVDILLPQCVLTHTPTPIVVRVKLPQPILDAGKPLGSCIVFVGATTKASGSTPKKGNWRVLVDPSTNPVVPLPYDTPHSSETSSAGTKTEGLVELKTNEGFQVALNESGETQALIYIEGWRDKTFTLHSRCCYCGSAGTGSGAELWSHFEAHSGDFQEHHVAKIIQPLTPMNFTWQVRAA